MRTPQARKGPPGFTNKLRQAQIEGTRPFEKKRAKGPPPGFEKKLLKPPPGFENNRHISYKCAICSAEFEEKRDLNEHVSNVHDEKNQVLKQRPIFESQVLKYLDGIGKEPRKLEETYKVGATLGEGGFGTVYSAIHIENQEKVAIKYVFKDKMIDTDWILIHGQKIPLELRLLDKVPFIYYVSTCRGEGVRKLQFLLIFSTIRICLRKGEGGVKKA